jgi:hypothetical protein
MEVMAASAVGVLLVSITVPVTHRVWLAGTTEQDAAQQQAIHAAMVRDSNGNPGGRLLTPGLINRLSYNGQQVPGEGEEDYAQNKTQNLYSACIARGLFGPQILVGATEVNPVVEAYTSYNYNAYRPDADSYWDPQFQARIDGVAGTGAKTRVLIQSTDGKREWGTVGVSENIISASLEALVDSMEFALLKK